MKTILLSIVFVAFILAAEFFVGSLAGCSQLTPPAKQAIQKGHDQAGIEAGKQKDRATTRTAQINANGKINDANAVNSPTAHPFAATNSTVKRARIELGGLALLGFIVFVVSMGLRSTALAGIASFGVPIGRSVAVISFATAIALPFIFNPCVAGSVFGGSLIWLIVEIVKYKSVPAGFEAFEADIQHLIAGVDVGKNEATVSMTPAESQAAASVETAVTAAIAKL
jgi:hypothetical protein